MTAAAQHRSAELAEHYREPDHRAALAVDPERAALAAAIERLAAAQSRVDRAIAALDRATDLGIECMHAEDAAAEALALARQAEPRRLVAELLGDDPDPAPTVAAAERAHAEAKAAHEAVHVAREALGAEWRAAQENLKFTERTRDAAVSEALRTSPEFRALVADFEQTQRRYGALRGALLRLGRALTEHERARLDTHHAHLPGDPAPILAAWEPAVLALQSDAAALLPGDDPTTPKEAA
jgi:hypothetical protein